MGRLVSGFKKGLVALVAPRYWKRRFPFLLTALVLSSLYFAHQGQRYYEGRQVLMALRNIHTPGEWYRYGADKNVKEAQYNLGLLYHRGFTVPQNDAEAARWMRKASDQDMAIAENELGTYYENGIGVAKDATEAARLYKKAAGHGLPPAMNNLGQLMLSGNGITEDKVRPAELFEHAATEGFIPAQINLSGIYERGDGVPVDLLKAYAWIAVADDGTDNTVYQRPIDETAARLAKSMDETTRQHAKDMAKMYVDQYGQKTREQFMNIVKQ